ncbi:hypothetical protein [Streptomyces sp. NPDC006879]|uniref:hypothetical protein n=1 Tax=Streptomyces sp. NPDC006879 TaxID=3364767 RepID=UPI0036D06534
MERGTPEGQRALSEAAGAGKRVEVLGERTEYTTTYANPDGESFQLEQSVVPVRVRNGPDRWVEPDATLVVRPDGGIGPRAAVVGVTFSPGGPGTGLVELKGRGGRSLTLGWPGRLPQPVLEGDDATYREVLPGVDLRMTATTEGFREVLVVKTPQAAANPALKRVEFSLSTNGLTVSGSKEGGFSAADSDGNDVFVAPPALMWDSSGPDATQAPTTTPQARTATGIRTASLSSPAVAPTEGDANDDPDSPLDGPGHGDKTAELPVHVEARSLAVVPDTDLLTQQDPAAYPLYIDPQIGTDDSEHLLLRSDGYSLYDWDNKADKQGRGVGKCGSWNGYYCGPGYVQRLYFEFGPQKLAGKEVLDASFTITEPWAFQCSPRNVQLVRTREIYKSTKWSTRPARLDMMGDRYVSAGRGSSCDPNSPAAPITFNDNPDEPDENLTPTVRDFAAGKFDRLTLELRAADESDTSAWKRFRNDAVLSVKYISRPAVPTGMGIVAGTGTSCSRDATDPDVISDPTPKLAARPQTAPGAEAEASLRSIFTVQKKQGDGQWVPVTGASYLETPTSGYVGDGKQVVRDVPVTLSDGVLYRTSSWTRSYAGSEVRASRATGNCYFKVDRAAPKAARIEFNGDPYQECDTTSCVPLGGPDIPGTVTFRAASGDTNSSYLYKLSTEKAWHSRSGSTVTVKITPTISGTVRLHVKAKDSLGRVGNERIVDFAVKEGSGPVARWSFHETSGDARDTSTTVSAYQDPAKLHNGATRPTDGRRGWLIEEEKEDRTLRLDGVDAYAATSGPVLDTRASYTIAGWVRPDRVDRDFSMVGQAGTAMSGIAISHSADGKWAARLPSGDTTASTDTTNKVLAKRDTVAACGPMSPPPTRPPPTCSSSTSTASSKGSRRSANPSTRPAR